MKDPAFLFYSNDFLSGTVLMSNEEVGIYIKLLCIQHQQGYLSSEDMTDMGATKKILNKFKQDENGNYYNERLKYEANKRKNYTESRRNNLKNAHMSSHMETHMDDHMENENINENINITENEIKDNRGMGEEGIEILENWETQFNDFYSKYPRKVKKQDVKKWFKKNKPSSELFSSMMNSLEQFRGSKDWLKDNGQYIPYPSTWLNQKRWEDEDIEDNQPMSALQRAWNRGVENG